MSHMAPESKKPKRISRACDSCHLKKARCDGCNPCARCHLENRVCTYTQKRRQPVKVLERGYVDILESKFNKVLSSFMILVSELSKGEDCQKYVRDATTSPTPSDEKTPTTTSNVVSLNTVIDRLQKSANATLMQNELDAIRGSEAIDNSALRVPPDAQEKLQMETGSHQPTATPLLKANDEPPTQTQTQTNLQSDHQQQSNTDKDSSKPEGDFIKQEKIMQDSHGQHAQATQSAQSSSKPTEPVSGGRNTQSRMTGQDNQFGNSQDAMPGVGNLQPSFVSGTGPEAPSDALGTPMQQVQTQEPPHLGTPYTPQHPMSYQDFGKPLMAPTPSNRLKRVGPGYGNGPEDRIRSWLQQQDTVTHPTAGPRVARATPNSSRVTPIARRRSLPKVHPQKATPQRVYGHKPSKSAHLSGLGVPAAYSVGPLPVNADARPSFLPVPQPSGQLPSPCDSLTPPNENTRDFSMNPSLLSTGYGPTLGYPYGSQFEATQNLKGGAQARPAEYTDVSQVIDGLQEPLFDMLNTDWQTGDLGNATALANIDPLEDIQMPPDQPFGSAIASPEPQPLFH